MPLRAEPEPDAKAAQPSALSERQFRDAMEFSAIVTAMVSLDGLWLYTNAAIRDLLGYDDVELRQKTFQELTYPDDLDADLRPVERKDPMARVVGDAEAAQAAADAVKAQTG